MENPQVRLEQMMRVLKEKHLRLTPQRLAILKILAEGKEHHTLEEIYHAIKASFSTTSLATIYKTINLLKDHNKVLELHFARLGKRYDGNRPYPHPHAICVRCGRIMEPEIPGLSDLSQEINKKTGYHITYHQINFYGLCPACQKGG